MNEFQRYPSKKILSFLMVFFHIYINSMYCILSDRQSKGEYVLQRFKSSYELGEKLLKEGSFQRAIDSLEKCLRLAREMEDRPCQIKCYMRLGLLYWNIGQLGESSKYYKEAILLAQELNLKEKYEKCRSALEIYQLYTEGKEHRSLGQLKKSLKNFEKAINLAKKIKSKEHELKCLRQLSITYWQLSDLQNFLFLNKKALKIAESLKHRTEEGRCLNHIGLYYWRLDYYSKALYFYEKALIIAQNLRNKKAESDCLNKIGLTYRNIGNYDKSLDYLIKAYKIAKEIEDDNLISMALNNIGNTFRDKGLLSGEKEDFYKTISYYEDSLKLAKKYHDIRTEIKALNNIGIANLDLENYCKALKYFQTGYKKAEEIQDIEVIGMILNNIGIVNFNLGNYKEAELFLQRAIELGLQIRGGHILWEAYLGLGQCYEKLNKFPDAVKCYQNAIDVIDNIRSNIIIDANKAGFVRDKLKVYESLMSLLYRLNIRDSTKAFGKEIFNIAERAKARAFLEVLGESEIIIRGRLNHELKEREIEIANKVSSVAQSLSDGHISESKRKELLKKLQLAEDEYILFISKIRSEIPEFVDIVLPEPCRFEQIQNQLLDEKTALIEYFLGEKQSFMFLFTKNDYNLYSLPARDDIKKSIKAYLKILSDPPKGRFRGHLAAKRLYQELLFPLEMIIPESVENLIIIPDGILYYLPFETLIPHIKNRSLRYDFLIDRYKISYAPSSSSLLFLINKKIKNRPSKDLLAIGDPVYALKSSKNDKGYRTQAEILKELYQSQGFDFSLLPHSKREIKKISKFFQKKNRDIYLNDRAREDVIKKIPLEDYQIIHFACHGFLDERYPFRSALVLSLSDGLKEDGFLKVHEIYNLRLSADLVVLSACQTGRGKLEKGEGILGLPRIFFYSGARSVVSSLWKISDKAAARFMYYFYLYLSQGKDKAQALCMAKVKMQNSKFSHPYYWAAFVLNGDYSSKLIFH